MIYLIVVNYESTELIRRLLASLPHPQEQSYEVILVNNSPSDRALQSLASDIVHILEAEANLGFGGGCNLGLQWVYARDKGAIAWLLNPDTQLHADSLKNVLPFCQSHPELSIIGTVIREPTGKIWFAGGEFEPGNGRIVASETLPRAGIAYWETAWITGCSLILNLQNFAECPQFAPDFFLYYEDFDFCRRYANQGHAIAVTGSIQVIHQPSSITSRNPALKLEYSTESYLLALAKHTPRRVVWYRLGRILLRALRMSVVEPPTAIAIIKGVQNYRVRVSRFDQSPHH
ncbi:MAG: glycosyltransferase family 2 protein [Leptolyngbyaceae cyanobacterium bins.349]|nr:glycosyltransferase family 2 protein [Leptolyngbyaceae cyanobacterium bins.349]